MTDQPAFLRAVDNGALLSFAQSDTLDALISDGAMVHITADVYSTVGWGPA